jgi:hypothetical protein
VARQLTNLSADLAGVSDRDESFPFLTVAAMNSIMAARPMRAGSRRRGFERATSLFPTCISIACG